MNGHPRYYEIIEELKELHSRKNSDYASAGDPLSNLRACEKLGIDPFTGVMIRFQDKWDRLIELTKKKLEGEGPAVKDESIIDTLMDNAVYSVLAIILLEEEKEKLCEDSTGHTPLIAESSSGSGSYTSKTTMNLKS